MNYLSIISEWLQEALRHNDVEQYKKLLLIKNILISAKTIEN